MKKILFTSTALLALTFYVLLLECSKKDPPKMQDTNKPSLIKPPQPQAACNCGTKPSGCSGMACVDKLFGGQNSKTFNVTWTSCVNPDPSNSYCNGLDIQGTTSTLTLCYMPGSCDHIIAKITNPPSCLPCLPNPYCIALAITCSDADHYNFAGNETYPDNVITVSVTADPKITVTCGPPGVPYDCVGNL